MHAIRIHRTGPPDVLQWEEASLERPRAGEARVRHTAIGLNFIDAYFRSGLYPVGALPTGLGTEAAGVVEEVGDGVTDVKVGERVAYGTGPLGAYSEARNLPASVLVPLPSDVDDAVGAAIMLKGMTAEYLLRRTYPVKRGDFILVHAAAGGVGLIACQWAKHLGATVMGTVGSAEKAKLAAANGCDHPILYRDVDFVARVRELTRGEGAAVVYDSVGADTFMKSLDCVRPRGMIVAFGQSSGLIPPFDLRLLSQKGSLFVTRPTLGHYTHTRQELLETAAALFDVVRSGVVKITIGQRYALEDAARAHTDLEARKTTGATVLLP